MALLSFRNLLPVGLAAGVAYFVLHNSVRYLGDRAKVGDDVLVPVGVGSPAVPGLPAGATQVMVHVTSTSGADVLVGTVTGFTTTGLGGVIPVPAGTVTVPASVDRGVVTGILRNGQTVSV